MRSLWPHGGLWRHQDFLKLWSAQTISLVGTQISQLAIPLAAILVLDASAFEVAVVGVAEFLPFLLFALPAGVWVDRLRRKPILVIADVGRGLALATIPLSYAFDALTIWQLYVVGFLVGTLTVFFDVAYQSYLPSLVKREQLVDGNSKLEISRSAASLAGPDIAGVLVAAITAPYAILVDAISFFASGGFILGIRRSEPQPERAEDRSMRKQPSRVCGTCWAIATGGRSPISRGAVERLRLGRRLDLPRLRRRGSTCRPLSSGSSSASGNVGWLLGAWSPGVSQARSASARRSSGPRSCSPARPRVPRAPQFAPIPFLIASFTPGQLRCRRLQCDGDQLPTGGDSRPHAWPAGTRPVASSSGARSARSAVGGVLAMQVGLGETPGSALSGHCPPACRCSSRRYARSGAWKTPSESTLPPSPPRRSTPECPPGPQGRPGLSRHQRCRRGHLGAHQPRLPAGPGKPSRGRRHRRAGRCRRYAQTDPPRAKRAGAVARTLMAPPPRRTHWKHCAPRSLP